MSKAYERAEQVFQTWKAKQKGLPQNIREQLILFRQKYLHQHAEEIRTRDESLLAEICNYLNLHRIPQT